MAKVCSNCGHELRDTDRFCVECGASIGQAMSQSQQTQWEYCEIVFRIDKQLSTIHKRDFLEVLFTIIPTSPTYFYDIIFWAKGVGPRGVFTVPTSEPHGSYTRDENAPPPGPSHASSEALSSSNQDNIKAVNLLVKELADSGWETLPDKGKYWFSYKFRRPVKS